MAAIFDFSQIRTSVILMSTLVVLPDLENMGIAVGISLLLRTKPKIRVLYICTSGSWLPFWFSTWIFVICYFCYRRQLCCLEKHYTDHCIAYHWSFTLVDMMMSFSFGNLYKIVSTDICCRGRHRVTSGNFSMGEAPKFADWVPRGIGESVPLNSYGNQSYSRKTEGVVTLPPPPPLSEGLRREAREERLRVIRDEDRVERYKGNGRKERR